MKYSTLQNTLNKLQKRFTNIGGEVIRRHTLLQIKLPEHRSVLHVYYNVEVKKLFFYGEHPSMLSGFDYPITVCDWFLKMREGRDPIVENFKVVKEHFQGWRMVHLRDNSRNPKAVVLLFKHYNKRREFKLIYPYRKKKLFIVFDDPIELARDTDPKIIIQKIEEVQKQIPRNKDLTQTKVYQNLKILGFEDSATLAEQQEKSICLIKNVPNHYIFLKLTRHGRLSLNQNQESIEDFTEMKELKVRFTPNEKILNLVFEDYIKPWIKIYGSNKDQCLLQSLETEPELIQQLDDLGLFHD